jgi:hypothetical protein
MPDCWVIDCLWAKCNKPVKLRLDQSFATLKTGLLQGLQIYLIWESKPDKKAQFLALFPSYFSTLVDY